MCLQFFQDSYLNSFFNSYNWIKYSIDEKNKQITPFQTLVNESELKLSVQNLMKARPEPIVAFLYIILDKLLSLITSSLFSGFHLIF